MSEEILSCADMCPSTLFHALTHRFMHTHTLSSSLFPMQITRQVNAAIEGTETSQIDAKCTTSKNDQGFKTISENNSMKNSP